MTLIGRDGIVTPKRSNGDTMPHFPVYTRETAIAISGSYFKQLHAKEPGTQKRILGKLLVDLTARRSFFVVKRSWRTLKGGYWRQHGHRGEPATPTYVEYYVVSKIDFVVASLEWAGGVIGEHEARDTRKDAEKLCREYHDPTLLLSS